MRWLVAIALCSGCCVNTWEIDSDSSKQPPGELASGGVRWTGPLKSRAVATGYDTILRVLSGDEYILHVPALTAGSYTTTLDRVRGNVVIATLHVAIDSSVTAQQVCMASDQDDYGTGRCGYSFAGTIAIAGDATATWTLDQIAYVAPGTPDC